MEKLSQQNFIFGFLFCALGFLPHLSWEYFQCGPYFLHLQTPASFSAMIKATWGDLIMMVIVYLFLSVIFRSFSWFQRDWNYHVFLVLVAASSALAIGVEIWALTSGRWAYTDKNPLIPILGVSILPVLQMALINPIAMYYSHKALRTITSREVSDKQIV